MTNEDVEEYKKIIEEQKKEIKQLKEENGWLKKVECLIEENKYLQKKYPDHANGLEIGLQSLEELRKEMIVQNGGRLI